MSDRPQTTFEVRCVRSDRTTYRLGPFATHPEAATHARAVLADGQAMRVEIFRRNPGGYALLSIMGKPTLRPSALLKEPNDAESRERRRGGLRCRASISSRNATSPSPT